MKIVIYKLKRSFFKKIELSFVVEIPEYQFVDDSDIGTVSGTIHEMMIIGTDEHPQKWKGLLTQGYFKHCNDKIQLFEKAKAAALSALAKD